MLLTADGRAVVADFGLSREAPNTAITMTIIGTPHYMAPEVLRGARVDAKSDVWSFGVIAWECASRKVPYAGTNPIVIMQNVAHAGLRPTFTAAERLRIPRLLCDVCDACMQEEPGRRPSFDDLVHVLSEPEGAPASAVN